MKTVRHSITIRAPREAVWAAMLGPETYRAWTAPFCEGSYYEGSWNTGDRIRFLGPGGEGGMTSVIAESRPPEFVSIKHLGIIKDGVEDTTSPAATAWAPSFENYTFAEKGGATELTVEVETPPDFEEFVNDAWPKALAKLKQICEEAASG
ncbi:MAG: SRPBCC family protein [Thermoanaerobaculia bacterium]